MKLTPPLQSLAAAMRVPILRHATTVTVVPLQQHQQPNIRSFSTSLTSHATAKSVDSSKAGKKSLRIRADPRIKMIRYHLFHPLTPRPLRLSRLRTLRHWTIHRAAQLLLHKDRLTRERELERQYNAMRDAMEELRLGVGDGGRLYRQAIDRKGIFGGIKVEKDTSSIVGNGGVPIEYGRAQTEGPPKGGWDEGWTRG